MITGDVPVREIPARAGQIDRFGTAPARPGMDPRTRGAHNLRPDDPDQMSEHSPRAWGRHFPTSIDTTRPSPRTSLPHGPNRPQTSPTTTFMPRGTRNLPQQLARVSGSPHTWGRLLRDTPSDGAFHAPRYQQRLEHVHQIPWLLATTSDSNFHGFDGPPPGLPQRALSWYYQRVLAAGTRNRTAQEALIGVLNMTRHPAKLLTPRVAGPTLVSTRPTTTLPTPTPGPRQSCVAMI
ncbi:hypothetical protein SAMN05444695_1312 [Rhodococcus triatomae]|uniref:Uncharacterized protein n=1 Tax=Rhodococcus triatomae TaxID=300028 RepID=A0A1G8T0G0_9NOCA|nr:hypothetical protein SAMN05444695_1312 [Rhodococcus triatomae]